MEYISPSKAAQKWGISRRTVRQYINQGRIQGAIYSESCTLIPKNAEKPCDLRKKENRSTTETDDEVLFVFSTAQYIPGKARHYAQGADNEIKLCALAELDYLCGNFEQTLEACEAIKSSGTKTAITLSQHTEALTSLFTQTTEKNEALIKMLKPDNGKAACKYNFSRYLNTVFFNRNTVSNINPVTDISYIQQKAKPFAVYIAARDIMLSGDVHRAIGMCEGALVFTDYQNPVMCIYLALTIAYGLVQLGQWENAESYFNLAWSLAEPDGIITPFAEFRHLLSGLLERCLRYAKPAEYRKILSLSTVYHKKWASIHNAITGDIITDKLAPIEYNVASLAAKGIANVDICSYLNISVNSVRAHLRNIYNKLGINSRKELSQYIIY